MTGRNVAGVRIIRGVTTVELHDGSVFWIAPRRKGELVAPDSQRNPLCYFTMIGKLPTQVAAVRIEPNALHEDGVTAVIAVGSFLLLRKATRFPGNSFRSASIGMAAVLAGTLVSVLTSSIWFALAGIAVEAADFYLGKRLAARPAVFRLTGA
ncbi:MAG: hypothetical protein ACRENP_17300 [Longimicrobiales bacterium]